MNKVLVCITIQENSRRLIKKGFQTAKNLDAPLHILHIKKGDSIFDTPDSSLLLDELFSYGSDLGGEVHFLCSNNICQTISDFIKDEAMTHLVIGKAPVCTTSPTDISKELTTTLKNINVITIEHETSLPLSV